MLPHPKNDPTAYYIGTDPEQPPDIARAKLTAFTTFTISGIPL